MFLVEFLRSQAIENVRHEIEIMRKVHHPNCIELHTVYESANHIYIVMELVCELQIYMYINICLHRHRKTYMYICVYMYIHIFIYIYILYIYI